MERRPFPWTYSAGLLLFLVGIHFGISLPDVDLRAPFLVHRSFLTHGPLLPLLLFTVVVKYGLSHVPRLFTIGFCLASTIHLSFDLFPRKWWGFALIWLPGYGRTSALFSWLWMGLGCVVCLYLALLLVKHIAETLLGGIALLATFFGNSSGEQKIGASFLVLLLAIGLALALPSRAAAMLRQMAHSDP